jgi:hypothetical protein
MINCEYCEVRSRSESGMSQHLRYVHQDKWKGSVKASFSEDFNMGTREPGTYHKPTKEERERATATRMSKTGKVSAVAKKGQKKAPIHQKCPWCGFKSVHPPAMAFHIRREHPKKWKGRLSLSLGQPMTTSDKYLEKRKAKKMARKIVATEQQTGPGRGHIDYCPNCGCNIKSFELAAGFNQIDEYYKHRHGG